MPVNILTQALPKAVSVDGCDYAVHTDFRVWIEAGRLMERIADASAGGDIAAFAADFVSLLMLCYIDLPPTVNTAIDALAAFYIGGESASGSGGKASGSRRTPVFCFEQDAAYIYAAFMAQYGIDLQAAELHWWQFRALFRALDDCRFTKIVEYRSVDIGAVDDEAQKRFYRKMKRMYRLADTRSDAAREDGFAELFTL